MVTFSEFPILFSPFFILSIHLFSINTRLMNLFSLKSIVFFFIDYLHGIIIYIILLLPVPTF